MGQINAYVMFGLGVLLLALLAYIAHDNPDASANIIWLTILALACAIIVAFLPGVARLEIPGWLTATGAVAVFIVVFLRMYDFALAQLQKENTSLQTNVSSLTDQVRSLRNSASFAQDCQMQIANIQNAIDSPDNSVLSLIERSNSSLVAARREAVAASTNTGDAGTCSRRALTSSQQLNNAIETLAKVGEKIQAARNALNEAKPK